MPYNELTRGEKGMQNLVVTRFEHKYLLNEAQAAQLRCTLDAALPPDPHNAGPTGSYLVRSLYFDTPDSRDYLDKVDGLFARQKLRLRVYGDGDAAKLECKQKQGDYQKKTSVWVSRAQCEAFCAGDFSSLLDADDEDARFLYALASRGYRPAGLVEYQRSAWYLGVRNTRVTLDFDVRGTDVLPSLWERDNLRELLDPGTVVLEVKFDRTLAPFVRRLLKGYQRSRLSLGKYERCRALHELL